MKYTTPLINNKGYLYYPPSTTTSYAAYINRHKPVTLQEYNPKLNLQLFKYIRKFIIRQEPWTEKQYLESITNIQKRKQYEQALEQLQVEGQPRSYVQPFTKIEKMSLIKKYKAPRMIQGRHKTHNIAYGKFVKPLEKSVTKYNPSTSQFFGKGDYDTQARKIKALAEKYRYYTECDHSTFDAHVTKEQLEISHRFVRCCYEQRHRREIKCLQKKMINNKTMSRTGDKYTVKATRMSGDVDTGFGNCLINYAILKSTLKDMKLDGEVIVNGDDSIIFTNEPIDIKLAEQLFKQYNMETKVNESVTNIHKVEFCRTKLVINSEGMPTMMIDPDRLIDIYGMQYKIKTPKKYHQYLKETAMCNAVINKNNPIGILWGKHFKINIPETSKKIIKDEHLIFLDLLEKDKSLKLKSLMPQYTSTELITESMCQAWPSVYDMESKIQKLAAIVENQTYTFSLTAANVYIDHDNKSVTYIKDQ